MSAEKINGAFLFIFILTSLSLFTGCLAALKISELRGPSAVQNGSTSRLVLDCVFVADEDDLEGLVVKWYFNNKPVPVYQWIPPNKPQTASVLKNGQNLSTDNGGIVGKMERKWEDLGILKGRLDLSHTVSPNSWAQHRALAILNPTTELSGEYSCSVSSFKAEDIKRKNLVVYVPAAQAELTYRKPSISSILVTCQALGLYPEPEVLVYKSRPYLDRTHRNVISNSDMSKQVLSSGNSFNVTAKVVLFDFELRGETIFTCEISIPGTNYHIYREVFYTPGEPQHQRSVFSSGETQKSNSILSPLMLGIFYLLKI